MDTISERNCDALEAAVTQKNVSLLKAKGFGGILNLYTMVAEPMEAPKYQCPGAVAAKVIIIRMDKKNGDGATVTENPLESTDAATSTKTALEGRSPAEEQAQKPPHPGADQDGCLASSPSYTIDELNWSGTDHDVAMDLINQVRQLKVPLRKIGRSREGEVEALEILRFAVQGKTVHVRNDHDETAAGPTQPMISTKCIDEDQEVNDILTSCRNRHEDLEIPDEPADESSATARRNFKKGLSNEDRSKYALKHPRDDNYLTKIALLASVFRKLGWKPTVDICCSPGGGNATGPFYYDPESDAFH